MVVGMTKWHWRAWFLVATTAALVIILLPVAFGRPMLTSGDPHVYRAQMELVFAGELPYIDFRFEHLPLALLPIVASHAVTVITGLDFAYPLMVISIAMIFATGVFVVRIGDELGLGMAGRRFVVMVAPMLLIIPFRIDALGVLLAVAALWYAIARQQRLSTATALAAILAKGWPVVLAATDWWRDERRRARLLVGFTIAVGMVMLALPGFRAGRSFDGVHQETLSGSFVIVARLLTGHEAQIVHHAGAEYVEASLLAVLVNLAVGGIIALAALSVLRRAFPWKGGVALTAALTYAVLLASPLLSAQFVLWLIPFVALVGSRRGQILLTLAAVLSVTLTAAWSPEALWWHSGWLVRNVVLVVGAVIAVADVRRVSSPDQDRPAPIQTATP